MLRSRFQNGWAKSRVGLHKRSFCLIMTSTQRVCFHVNGADRYTNSGRFALNHVPLMTYQSKSKLQSQLTKQPQSRIYSSIPNDTQWDSLIRKGWNRLKVAVKTFMIGTKALYKDVKTMYEIRSKQGKYTITNHAPQGIAPGRTNFPLNRQQLQFTFNTRKSLLKMLPTVMLFFVPFLGYFVPLIAFMYPDKLLSNHFLTDDEKKSLTVFKTRESTLVFRTLMGELRTHATEEQMNLLARLGRQLCASDSDWTDVCSLIQDKPFLPLEMKQISVNHTNLLCKGWGLRLWIPLMSRKQQLLEKHMNYLFTCDWLMTLEGGAEKLTGEELLDACVERNIAVVDMKDTDRLQKQLETWISLTTSFKECPVSLMAHLPMTQYLSDSRT